MSVVYFIFSGVARWYRLSSVIQSQKIELTVSWLLIALFPQIMFAQKQTINELSYGTWDKIEYNSCKISNDGKYVLYGIANDNIERRLIIKSLYNFWKFEIVDGDARTAAFTKDGSYVIFKTTNDSLYVLKLSNHQFTRIVSNVKSSQLCEFGSSKWVTYLTYDQTLIRYELGSEKEVKYPHVEEYSSNKDGNVFLISTTVDQNDRVTRKLVLVNLKGGKQVNLPVVKGSLSNFVIDNNGEQVCFEIDSELNSKSNYSLGYYNVQSNSLKAINVHDLGLDTNFCIGSWQNLFRFSNSGDKFYFPVVKSMDNVKAIKSNKQSVTVDVWDYKDVFLQSQHLAGIDPKIFTAVFMPRHNKIVQLDRENFQKVIVPNDGDGQFALVATRENTDERYWQYDARPSYYLEKMENGFKKLMLDHVKTIERRQIDFSPKGRFILWFNREEKNYFTYNLETGMISNVSKNVPFPLYREDFSFPDFAPSYGLAGWEEGDKSILVYDKYDIWRIDPCGVKPPENLTNGYGRKHGYVLRKASVNDNFFDIPIVKIGEVVLLNIFDTQSKNSGFGEIKLCQIRNPKILSLSPFKYELSIQKSENTDCFIVIRMSEKEPPNIYSTKDFKKFYSITEINPQRNYNWLSSQLVRWKVNDSTIGEGVLYKPENFDSTKKYPVIFTFYEKGSDDIHRFLYPEASGGEVNIPYFVSNGYIVFRPNIYFQVGNTGESCSNSLVTAAKFISEKFWVDSLKLGLSAISFGGYQINYTVTKTNCFAAAAPSAAPSDFVSLYDQIRSGDLGKSAQFVMEIGQNRIGEALWQNQLAYITNSPIFFADKVQTPLLIMHNKEDGNVPWEQGLEWFTALRRLQKPAWMLQYDKEPHGLYIPENQKDFSIRLGQFFDHFLKGAPAPVWMTQGIPAKLKGIITGYELDPSGNCGKDCKVCKMWNEKMKKDSLGTMREKEEKTKTEHWIGN